MEMIKMSKKDNNIKQVKMEDMSTGIKDEVHEWGKHPNSQANLKPWPKGVSGNPLGRPHKFNRFTKALNEVGMTYKEIRRYDFESGEFYIETTDKTRKEEDLDSIWDYAREGEIQFINILVHLGCLNKEK